VKKLLVFLFIMTFLTACTDKAEPQVEDLVFSDIAKNLEATAGNEFKIVIPSNPSTGYHWELGDGLDENIVKFVSKDYSPETSLVPGSGGQDVWVFEAMNAGEAYITLWYYSPSNELAEPQQKVTFTVTVK
jgi:predicted secreted protein